METTIKYSAGMGRRIREVRKRADLGQLDLANELGVTRQSISGYETERLRPSFDVIHRICNLYNVYPWWLLYGVNSPPVNPDTIGADSHPAGPLSLSNSQQALIEYIKSNRAAAEKLGAHLWNKALDL